ncbi:relaxase/mobilization nuclease domain-containing protein, partial [Enterobacter hormaechei subsp. xiangfangensis]
MIVGFSRHGTGGGGGPVGYVTDKTRPGRENSPPEVLRGSPEATRNLIDSLDFRHKYTSGVLSFAPEEKVTPEMEQEFMDRFEQVAFAGLEADQYNILWVRHTHAGHHELHFVTPRVELGTGKSLNIRPPGDAAKQAFDDLRSEINARYGLADPDDPRRAREIAQPDHELKIAAEALRRGEKPQEDIRLLIDAVLSQRAAQGLIRSRSDVIEQVSDLGMQVTREGKNYITVSDPQSGQRWRMKGGLYEREFDAAGAVEAAASRRERDYSKPDEAAAEQFAKRVERHISARAEYHAGRYAPAAARHDRGYAPEPAEHVADRREKPGDIPGPECGYDLGRYLSERLGPEYVSGK